MRLKMFLLLSVLFTIGVLLNIAPLIGAALIGGGLSGLSGFFGARAEERAAADQRAREEARRGRARDFISSGPTYRPFRQYQPFQAQQYTSPLQGQAQTALSQFLSGQLTPAQQGTLAQQRQLGEEQIARTGASRGTPIGGQLALSTQLARDIALGGARLAGEQTQRGLQLALPYQQFEAQQFYRPQEIAREEQRASFEFGLADFIRQQQEAARRRELLAQYA
jgi:hypothetical protein